MRSTRNLHGYGIAAETAAAVANLVGAGSAVVGAGTGIWSVAQQRALAEQGMRSQKAIALRQLRQAERTGNRDRVIAARRNILEMMSAPAYQLAEAKQKQNTRLILLGVVGITLLAWFGTRKGR